MEKVNGIFGISFLVQYVIFKKKIDWSSEVEEFHKKYLEQIAKMPVPKWYQFKTRTNIRAIKWFDKHCRK